MNQIFPDPSLLWMLRRVVGVGLLYHLYRNDYTPTLSDTLGSYTEAVWSGYAPVLAPAAAWTTAVVITHLGDLQAPPIQFRNTSPAAVSVYGFFVTDNTGLQLVCASRFDEAPITIQVGDAYPVTPLLGSYSGLQA